MFFTRRKKLPPLAPPAPIGQREEVAYVLLEEARLRCERLREQTSADAARRPLDILHRELGLAGFCASAHLSSQRRQHALAMARQQFEPARATLPEFGGLPRLVERAEHAIQECLIAPGLSDHMHEAHLHLIAARELLRVAAGQRRQASATPHRRALKT